MRRGHPLTTETRAKIAAARRLYLADPEVWERRMLAANTPAAKAHRSACSRALWQTPAYRTRTLAAIAATTAARRAREAARIELAYRRALEQQRGGHEHSRVGHDA